MKLRKIFDFLWSKEQNKNISLNTENFLSYSQEGEDVLLKRIFDRKISNGFYIDIGAYHPKYLSNTAIFYNKGWRGINIEANPTKFEIFNILRPNDINLNTALTSKSGEIKMTCFAESAYNTLDPTIAKLHELKSSIIDEIVVNTARLDQVLDKYSYEFNEIDFMSIDIEGLELEVLQTNNWIKYSPKVIVCEIFLESYENLMEHEITRYLKQKDYFVFSKLFHSVFYIRKDCSHLVYR